MKTAILLMAAAILIIITMRPGFCVAQENSDSQDINPGDFISESKRVFKNWNLGEAEITAIVLTEPDQDKRAFTAGIIDEDGSFNFQLPETVSTSVPVNSYLRPCTNPQEEVSDGSGVTLAYVGLYASQNGEPIGSLTPANPVRAAYNMNARNINNGNLGRYYVWVYADGDASVQINCKKNVDMTDGKEYEYEDMEVEDRFNFQFKKGWNLIQAEVIDYIWVGLTKHYMEREWTVVGDFPTDVKWVFRAAID